MSQLTVISFIFCLILVSTVAQRFTRPTRRERIDLLKLSKVCTRELSFPRNDANRLVRGYLDRKDEEAQCFVRCLYTKANIMNEDGDIDEEGLKRMLPKAVFPPDKVPGWIEMCRDVEAENHCERAYNTYACFLKAVWPDEESYQKEVSGIKEGSGEAVNRLAFINYGKD